jgi:hypothetical protein
MEPAADGSPLEPSMATAPAKKLPTSVHVWLWIFLAAWAISFFLPAVLMGTWGGEQTGRGWELAESSFVLFFVPVKGMWLILIPQIWSVWVNLFMLLAPFEIKRVERGQGRIFAVLFSIATVIPVAIAYIPHSVDPADIRRFLAGFYLWDFSMIATAALFLRTLWRSRLATIPAACLMGLLLSVPVYRGELDFLPPPLKWALEPRSGEGPQVRLTTIRLVASSPNPSLMGNSVSFTATISAADGSMPTGTVVLVEGRTLLGKAPSTAGVATFSTNALKIGEHFITANFAADVTTNYLGSFSQGLIQMVNDPNDTGTQTVLTLAERHPQPTPDQIGFTVKAKITTIGSYTPVTSGQVILVFMHDFTTAVKLDHDGVVTVPSALPGALWRGYQVEAIYNGGRGYQASMSTLTLQ